MAIIGIGCAALEFRIDLKSGVPEYRQVVEQVKFAIARSDLKTGDQLPTVRWLAIDLSIKIDRIDDASVRHNAVFILAVKN